jgi:hypothetical protein
VLQALWGEVIRMFRNGLIFLSSLLLVSCTSYTHYSYNSNELLLGNAEVTLVFTEGYNEETKAKLPRGVQFWVTANIAENLKVFEVRDIELVSPIEDQNYYTGNIQGREFRKLSAESGKINSVASFSLNFSEPPPEVLLLKATIIIYSDDSDAIEEETIKVTFKLDTGIEHHWIWFDEQMSV